MKIPNKGVCWILLIVVLGTVAFVISRFITHRKTEEMASGCCKIKKVCGYTKLLKYIPWTEITFPAPWNWKCTDVN